MVLLFQSVSSDGAPSLVSPTDVLEGATGGGSEETMDGEKFTPCKVEKFDPDYNTYEYGNEDQSSRFSNYSSSNDTDFESPQTNLASPQHVMHNHSYPMQPGQVPKEQRRSSNTKKGEDSKSIYGRDEKKAKAMKIPFSVEDIVQTPVEQFNDMLQNSSLSEAQLQLIRDIRRRGKNKAAAQNCRKRKVEVIQTLEEEVEKMRRERDRLRSQRRSADKELRDIRQNYDRMYLEVFHSLRDEDGQPYDPNEYTLQHTSDGNVFLVPRNGTTTFKKDTKEKAPRKRKAPGKRE